MWLGKPLDGDRIEAVGVRHNRGGQRGSLHNGLGCHSMILSDNFSVLDPDLGLMHSHWPIKSAANVVFARPHNFDRRLATECRKDEGGFRRVVRHRAGATSEGPPA